MLAVLHFASLETSGDAAAPAAPRLRRHGAAAGMRKRSASKYAAGSSSDAKEAKESQASTFTGDSSTSSSRLPHTTAAGRWSALPD